MIKKDNYPKDALPVYQVEELSLEEALLVMAADKGPGRTAAAVVGAGEVTAKAGELWLDAVNA